MKRAIAGRKAGAYPSPSLNISPAEVEQMASEFEEVEKFIVAIENKACFKNRT